MELKAFVRYTALAAILAFTLAASEHHGLVKFGPVPVPGATVTATQGDKKVVAITNQDGIYTFPDLADGIWNIQVDMLAFAPVSKELGISPSSPAAEWELKLLSMEEMKPTKAPPPPPGTTPAPGTGAPATAAAAAEKAPSIAAATAAAAAANGKNAAANSSKNGKKGATKNSTTSANAQQGFQRADVNSAGGGDSAAPANNDGANLANSDAATSASSEAMVVNGSASTGIERRAIGNFRKGPGSLYTGGLMFRWSNSVLNAKQYSVSGGDVVKPYFNNMTFGPTVQGPLIIPHLFRVNNANFSVSYSGSRNRTPDSVPALMPTDAQRKGDFSNLYDQTGKLIVIYDPTTGQPFPQNKIDPLRFSKQAKTLLSLYPGPNVLGTTYNYQLALNGRSSADNIQTRINKTFNMKNALNGSFAYQNTRGQNPNVFAFTDQTKGSGINFGLGYRHMFNRQISGNFGFNYSRGTNHAIPFFANRTNVSGDAGITGNLQDPAYWGPPNLNFGTGIQGLFDSNQNLTRNQTAAFTGQLTWIRRPHNMQIGGDIRLQQFNVLSQNNPRGSFGFTGAQTQQIVNGVPNTATGSDFADFLLGLPDSIGIAYGNADKYLRGKSYDAYFNDDWRMSSVFTLNWGVRWEYNTPMIEKYGRIVNLDVSPGFANAVPVIANTPTGSLTGRGYPDSLIRPYKHGIGPRFSFAWHPFFGASTVVRGGYSLTFDSSVYNTILGSMLQQSPLSNSYSLQNPVGSGVTMASFPKPTSTTCGAATTCNTFGVDPDFRPGYAQNFQVSVQQNLTGSMVATVVYLGTKGTHAVQQFVPNTYPTGAINPCPTCLAGYTYMTSNGNSTRHSGQLALRRRFHTGFATSLQYTYSKALDDASLGGRGGGGGFVAQDWRNLAAERGLSPFDQRHLINFQMQYTTGMGIHGGTLLSGWRGAAFKGWTIVTNIDTGTGTPLTPRLIGLAGKTGVGGTLRPQYTGLDVYAAPAGLFLNPLAFSAPPVGFWGNAGRNSITGPYRFTMNASMQRSFDRLDLTIDATNPLNRVSFNTWNTTWGSPQFGGLPSSANGMRSMQATLRWRF